jgi:hypothetical protein
MRVCSSRGSPRSSARTRGLIVEAIHCNFRTRFSRIAAPADGVPDPGARFQFARVRRGQPHRLPGPVRLRLRIYWRQTFGARSEAGRYAGTSIPIDAGCFTPYQKRLHVRPYALLVSVHNAEHELDEFLEAMQPFRDRLCLIDDCSTDYTSALIRQAGPAASEASATARSRARSARCSTRCRRKSKRWWCSIPTP